MIYKYIVTGLLNTAISLSVIFILYEVLALNYNVAYFLGYVTALINSFIMNKKFTFESGNPWKGEVVGFVKAFIISYGMSHIFLNIMIEIFNFNVFFSIICSMIFYTIVGYVLNKKVFAQDAV
jgi:putative flippase GtrA